MDIAIRPAILNGSVRAIGSKSDIHRLMICAAMADGVTKISGIVGSEDVHATASCLRALGADVRIDGTECTIVPGKCVENPSLDCGESGSTFRFILPVTAALCGSGSFTGSGRLPNRPIGELVTAMRSGGVKFSAESLPLSISGKLRPGCYTIPGNVSSQYISGLLMALSITPGESVVNLSSHLESSAYVDMTLDTLRIFGADITVSENSYKIIGKQKLTSPGSIDADGDWSNSAFFLASAAINGEVTVTGLRRNSVQGDKQVAEILSDFGADVQWNGDAVTVKSGELHGCVIDLTNIPDSLPILAVVAAFAKGETHFTGAARLRLKESDRLKTVSDMLRNLGGTVTELPDGLIVTGGKLIGGSVDGAGDHRIVMAGAIAAAHCMEEVKIIGAQAVNKSYPDFFRDFSQLGGQCNVI